MNFTISTNPNKKLHKDLYTQIDMLSDLINRKRFDLKKELHDYELLNFKVKLFPSPQELNPWYHN